MKKKVLNLLLFFTDVFPRADTVGVCRKASWLLPEGHL